jgi:hypothetical protein
VVTDSGFQPNQAVYTPAASSWNYRTFDHSVQLARNTRYWLVWDLPVQPNDHYYTLRTANYTSGTVKYRANGGAWQTPYSGGDPDIAFSLERWSGANIQGDGSYIYSSRPDYFSGMTGEALRNYDQGSDWLDNEWAAISSVATVNGLGANTRATLDRSVIYNTVTSSDWMDDEDAALIKRFTGTNAAVQTWYISAGMVVDATNAMANYSNFSAVAERDIGLLGLNTISMKVGSNVSFPLIATRDGNIYSSAPQTSSNHRTDAARRTFEGMIYSKNGDVAFDHICANRTTCSSNGTAIVGHNVYMTNYAWIDYNASFADCDCITGTASPSNAYSWGEQ